MPDSDEPESHNLTQLDTTLAELFAVACRAVVMEAKGMALMEDPALSPQDRETVAREISRMREVKAWARKELGKHGQQP